MVNDQLKCDKEFLKLMAAFDYLGIQRNHFTSYEYSTLVQHIGCILQATGFLKSFDDFTPYIRTMSRKLMAAKYRYYEAHGITEADFRFFVSKRAKE
jgi:hypothetical protein